MSYKVTPPDLKHCKSYEVFKKELEIWELTTPVPEEKKGAVIASLLPNDCKLKKDLKDTFFERVNVKLLTDKGGLKLVKDFLDEQLSEDDLEKKVRTWDDLEDCTRGQKDIDEFLSDFDRAYRKAAEASGLTIPSSVRAFMVLKRANVNKTQRILIMSKLDQNEKDKMFENMGRELKLVLGSGPGALSKSDGLGEAVKYERTDIPSEDVLYTAGYERRGGGNYRGGGFRGGRGGAWRGGGQGRGGKYENSREHAKPYEKPKKRTNKPAEDGNPTTCHHCGSKYHCKNKCPDYEHGAFVAEDEVVEKPCLFIQDKNSHKKL